MNDPGELCARLREFEALPSEMRASNPVLPWNTRDDLPEEDAELQRRLMLAADAEQGFDVGVRIKPDGSISRMRLHAPMPQTRTRADMCLHGHDLTLPRAIVSGNCRECNREAVRRYHARKKGP